MGEPRAPRSTRARRGLRRTKIAACVFLALGGGGIVAAALLGDRIGRWSDDFALRRFDRRMGRVEVGWTSERLLAHAGPPDEKVGDDWVYRLEVPYGPQSARGHEYTITLRDGVVVRIESVELRTFY